MFDQLPNTYKGIHNQCAHMKAKPDLQNKLKYK